MKPETNHSGPINKGRSALLFLLFVFLALPLKSQQPVALHPVVGDTIDLIEKLDYFLFPDVPDSKFEQGVLIPNAQDYQLLVWHKDEISKMDVSAEDFIIFSENVEKLSAYYQQKEEEAPVKESLLISGDSIPFGLDIEWMSQKQKRKMIKASKRYNSLKLDADEMGLMGFEREKYIKTAGMLIID